MIPDVAELRAFGQVCRRVDELGVDVATWRAGMRRCARREGMRIRTFVVDHADDNGGDPPGGDDAKPRPGASASVLVFAVRTDLPPTDPVLLADAVNRLPTPPGFRLGESSDPLASVTSLTDERARRAGHPCTDPYPDRG